VTLQNIGGIPTTTVIESLGNGGPGGPSFAASFSCRPGIELSTPLVGGNDTINAREGNNGVSAGQARTRSPLARARM
jgi:hypothetical protein